MPVGTNRADKIRITDEVTKRCFYLKRKVLWIFICIQPRSAENEQSTVKPWLNIIKWQRSHGMDSTTCEATPVQTVNLVLWLRNESESQCGTQFEHDLSKSLIKISLIFCITPRKCQLGKPLINDKQCNYAWYSAWLRSLPRWGVRTRLCHGRARAAGLRGEADWLPARPRSELKENDSAPASDSPVSWFIAETRVLCRRVRAFPCIYTRAEDCSTVAPLSTLNLEIKEVIVTLWFLKASTVVLSQKSQNSQKNSNQYSVGVKFLSELRGRLSVRWLSMLVPTGQQLTLIAEHYCCLAQEILRCSYCCALCVCVCMCVYVWMCRCQSLFAETLVQQHSGEVTLIRAFERCDYLRLCRFSVLAGVPPPSICGVCLHFPSLWSSSLLLSLLLTRWGYFALCCWQLSCALYITKKASWT